MARPVSIDDDLLLSTAREVFLEKGLRATTAEISERAGVSQGILFKRFGTKQALFKAAMNAEDNVETPVPIDFGDRIGKGSVQGTLNDLGNMLVHKFFGIIPTLMMDWSNTRQDTDSASSPTAPKSVRPEAACMAGPERAAQGIRLIAGYLSEEVKLGRINCQNCEIVAQTFVGACWHYSFLQVMLGEVHQQPLTSEEYVKGVVQTIWEGIAPSTNELTGPR